MDNVQFLYQVGCGENGGNNAHSNDPDRSRIPALSVEVVKWQKLTSSSPRCGARVAIINTRLFQPPGVAQFPNSIRNIGFTRQSPVQKRSAKTLPLSSSKGGSE